MKLQTKSVLAILGAGVLVIVLGYVVVVGFSYLIGKKIYVINDTTKGVTVTFLLQNHDDSGLYLSEARNLTQGEDVRVGFGFESVRCVYISAEQDEYSSVFDYGDYHAENQMKLLGVSISTVLRSGAPCPLNKSEVQEGVKNRVQVDGKL